MHIIPCHIYTSIPIKMSDIVRKWVHTCSYIIRVFFTYMIVVTVFNKVWILGYYNWFSRWCWCPRCFLQLLNDIKRFNKLNITNFTKQRAPWSVSALHLVSHVLPRITEPMQRNPPQIDVSQAPTYSHPVNRAIRHDTMGLRTLHIEYASGRQKKKQQWHAFGTHQIWTVK